MHTAVSSTLEAAGASLGPLGTMSALRGLAATCATQVAEHAQPLLQVWTLVLLPLSCAQSATLSTPAAQW